MKWHRINALLIRHLYLFNRDSGLCAYSYGGRRYEYSCSLVLSIQLSYVRTLSGALYAEPLDFWIGNRFVYDGSHSSLRNIGASARFRAVVFGSTVLCRILSCLSASLCRAMDFILDPFHLCV